ncbi:MAG: hypothetical protein V5B34_07020 [Accumulibacter sp.]
MGIIRAKAPRATMHRKLHHALPANRGRFSTSPAIHEVRMCILSRFNGARPQGSLCAAKDGMKPMLRRKTDYCIPAWIGEKY